MAQKYLRKCISLPNGKRKDVYAKTKKELEEKVLRVKIEAGAGVDVTDTTTVEELTQLWIEVYKRPFVSTQTLNCTISILNNHILPFIGKRTVRSIRGADIVSLVSSHGTGSKATNRRIVFICRALFDLAMDQNIIVKNPVPNNVPVVGTTAKEAVPLSQDETSLLLGRMDHSSPLYLYTLIGINTGMRRSEIAALKWDCVDLEHDIIYVHRNVHIAKNGSRVVEEGPEAMKTPCSYRDVPIPLMLHVALSAIKDRTGFVVHSKGTPQRFFSTCYSSWMDRAWNKYLPERPDMHTHLLRHTYTTRLFESGLDVKEIARLLGHTSITMTLGTYTHYDEARKDATFEHTRNALNDCLRDDAVKSEKAI